MLAVLLVAVAAVGLSGAFLARRPRRAHAAPVVVNEPHPLSETDHRDLARLEREELEAYVTAQIWEFLDDSGLWLPNGTTVETVFRPVEGVGGDFLGTMTDGSRAVAYVGDVAGHGLDAALVALRVKEAVGGALQGGVDIAEVTNRANALLADELPGLATFFICSVEDDRLEYVNAGQVAPQAFDTSADGDLAPTGPILGAVDHVYEPGELTIAADSRVVAFTDGVTDAYRADGGLTLSEARTILSTPGSLPQLLTALDDKRAEPVCDDVAGFELTVGE